MQITEYTVGKPVDTPLLAALVADLHNKPYYEKVLREIQKRKPDLIAVPGDLMNDPAHSANGFDFLARAARIAPVFYSFGNHERVPPEERGRIADTGAILLDDADMPFRGILIGGLSSGGCTGGHRNLCRTPPPKLSFLDAFAARPGFKLLLCHHPEYYPDYIRGKNVDLIFSGHAHGGQWRLFGRGFFAPGQGFFPKYTAGVHDGRLVVSRGLANNSALPRIFNPPELVFVRIVPQNAEMKGNAR